MRYAVVSDIHANIQAWDAVLLDIRGQDIDCILCLGDIVGYGPDPVEVLESVHSNVDYIILGNHDAVVCGKMSSSLFSDDAAKIINWTKSALNKNAISLFNKLPLSLSGENFRCCHGAFVSPGKFDYIFTESDALESFFAVSEQLLFCGHTHLSGLFVLGGSGLPHYLEPQDFHVEASKRYIVNVGSVGNPRSGAPLATYCIYDVTAGDVFWRSVSFDLYAYKKALISRGLPLSSSMFLEFDSRIDQAPIRQQVSFSPPKELNRAMQQTLAVKEIDQLKSKIRYWQVFSIILLFLFIMLGLALPFMFTKNNKEVIGPQDFISLTATPLPFSKNLLPSLHSATNDLTANIQIVFMNKKAQQYSFFSQPDLNGVKFDSVDKSGEIQIVFPPFSHINKGTKFCIEGTFKKSDDFSGDIYLKVFISRKGRRTFETLFIKSPNPNLIRKGGWIVAKKTFTVDGDITKIQCLFSGTFVGSLEIGKIELYKIPDSK